MRGLLGNASWHPRAPSPICLELTCSTSRLIQLRAAGAAAATAALQHQQHELYGFPMVFLGIYMEIVRRHVCCIKQVHCAGVPKRTIAGDRTASKQQNIEDMKREQCTPRECASAPTTITRNTKSERMRVVTQNTGTQCALKWLRPHFNGAHFAGLETVPFTEEVRLDSVGNTGLSARTMDPSTHNHSERCKLPLHRTKKRNQCTGTWIGCQQPLPTVPCCSSYCLRPWCSSCALLPVPVSMP